MTRTKTHRVAMLTYPNGQILDVVGPLEVMSRTSRWLIDNGIVKRPAYRVEIIAPAAGPVTMSSGLQVVAERSYGQMRKVDTLMIGGGIGFAAARENAALLAWVRRMLPRVERLASICTGAMILGRAGLLDGLRATTHWEYCSQLQAECPDAEVEADAIYVEQGKLYTSAGVTAGMDLALALVEEDWGKDVALAVAQELVMFMKRPGGQSQFSSFMAAQQTDSDRFRDLQVWMQTHLHQDLSVESLAEKMSMSPRNFARAFARAAGETPGRYVQRARLEAARRDLEESRRGVDQVALRCGFGSAETMRRTFVRHLKISPSDYRQRFRSARVA